MTPTTVRRARAARRRQRRLGGVVNDLSASEWTNLVAAWGGCAYCGVTNARLQKDCIQPIAHGGRYTLTNVVPACQSCNASKCEQEVTGWLRRKGLDEAAFLLRYAEVRRLLSPQSAAQNERPEPQFGPSARSEGFEPPTF